jgi:hypothetical protein
MELLVMGREVAVSEIVHTRDGVGEVHPKVMEWQAKEEERSSLVNLI